MYGISVFSRAFVGDLATDEANLRPPCMAPWQLVLCKVYAAPETTFSEFTEFCNKYIQLSKIKTFLFIFAHFNWKKLYAFK